MSAPLHVVILAAGEGKRMKSSLPKVLQSIAGRPMLAHVIETARVLASIEGKTIVLTGALNPARFRGSDAEFNIGTAVGAVQSLPAGVYIAMNGRIWDPLKVRKNVDANRFEAMN